MTEEKGTLLPPHRHCERSEAIHNCRHGGTLDRFDASAPRTATTSIHLPVLPRPIRLAQLTPQNLAARIARQRRQELDALRCLEPGDALAGEVDDVGGGRLLAGL